MYKEVTCNHYVDIMFMHASPSPARPEIFQELCECSDDAELQVRLEQHTYLLVRDTHVNTGVTT